LSIVHDAANSPQTVPLQGNGVPQATLQPDPFYFGNVVVLTSSRTKTFTLTNNLWVGLNIGGLAISGDFSIASTTCGSLLAARSTCTISVVCNPTQLGPRSVVLTVADSTSNSPQEAALTGTGITAPSPTATPTFTATSVPTPTALPTATATPATTP